MSLGPGVLMHMVQHFEEVQAGLNFEFMYWLPLTLRDELPLNITLERELLYQIGPSDL